MNYLSLVRGYPRYLAFGFTQSFFSSLGQTFLLALFIPLIRDSFQQSVTSMGSYYGLLTLASAFTLYFTGSWVDKVNLRLYVLGVGLVVAVGCFLLSFSSSFAVVLVGLFLIRHGGQGLMSHTASTAMSRYFTVDRGKSLSIAGLGIALGEASLPLLITFSLLTNSWQWTYFVLGLSCLLVFLPLSLFFVKKDDDICFSGASQILEVSSSLALEPSKGDDQSQSKLERVELNWNRRQVLSHPYFWLLLPLLLAPPFLGTGYFFFQAEIAASKSWSKELFASCFVAYGLSSAISSFVSGPFIDRMGGSKLLPFSLLPMAVGTYCLAAFPGLWSGYVFMIMLGVSFGTVSNVRNSMWAEIFGRKHLGAIKSFAAMLMVFSTALAPSLGGWLFDRGFSVTQLLEGCIYLALGCTVLAFFARPPKPLDHGITSST